MKAVLESGSFHTRGIQTSNDSVEISISGSKSESNRLLILQAQFPNISIENLSDSDDTEVLKKGLQVANGEVDVHHAGTAMRFLTAYFAVKEGAEITLTGSKRMQERPIAILVDALRSIGAEIEYLKNDGFPPLKIKGRNLQKTNVSIQSNVSSQYISALMLVAPMLQNGLNVKLEGKTTSLPYIEMTLSLMTRIGVKAQFNKNEIIISSTKNIQDISLVVESDWSSASYFYSLVALSGVNATNKIVLKSYIQGSIQGDAALDEIYRALGVKTVFNDVEKSITISKIETRLPDCLSFDLSNTPDLAQTISVSCFGLGIACKLTGLHTLKIKETDRLLALKTELEKLGATVEVDETSLTLKRATSIKTNAVIETYQDHRMAMAFAPLFLKTNLTINNAEVVSKSYPNFWNDLQKFGIDLALIP